MTAVLDVRELAMHFPLERGEVRAVDGVSFTLARGRVLGLVGESGCGKSMTALCLMRLVPQPGRIVGGKVLLEGRDLLALPEREMRAVRGAGLAMIFQEPMTALNPVLTVGSQIAESVALHAPVGRRAAWERAVALLAEVGIPEPARRALDYPHQLSGGQRQRVMIAMALVNNPRLLIADEPTTALDVTIQAQILDLLSELRERYKLAVLFISHDLGVIARVADQVAVMYAGEIVEMGPVRSIFAAAVHPYTRGLISAIPTLKTDRSRPLATVEKQPPAEATPALREVAPEHWARTAET